MWARVRRRGHPGRRRALRCQETFRSSWSCHRSRRGQGPVAPEQSRPGRTPPTGLAATLCGRGSRSTSRVTGPVGVARNARIPPDSYVCCPAPPGQASGPDSRGLEGKAVRNPPKSSPALPDTECSKMKQPHPPARELLKIQGKKIRHECLAPLLPPLLAPTPALQSFRPAEMISRFSSGNS